jgi:hypothetical protein
VGCSGACFGCNYVFLNSQRWKTTAPPHNPKSITNVKKTTQQRNLHHLPDDPDLIAWRKLLAPVLRHPPPGLPLSCWRDPFIAVRPTGPGGEDGPSSEREWTMLLASGVRGRGGAVLVFKSRRLLGGGSVSCWAGQDRGLVALCVTFA